MSTATAADFGGLLRRWRGSRRYTQEQLAEEAEISTRHLSCLENGKASPSREMVLILASALELELRDRNVLLGAAGFAPLYRASPLEAAAMTPLRAAVTLLLRQQEPYGAVLVDRLWNVLQWNQGALRLFGHLLGGPPADPLVATNVLHALFSPDGLRPYLVNWEQVACYTMERLHREIAQNPDDEERRALRRALLVYPNLPERLRSSDLQAGVDPFLSMHLRRGPLELRLWTTLTTLGTPLDVTAQELIIESYFPADAESERVIREMAG